MDLVDVLRSTNECCSENGHAQVAAQLCGKDYQMNPVANLFLRHIRVSESAGGAELSTNDGVNAIDVCTKLFLDFVGNDDVSSVVHALITSTAMKERSAALLPTWKMSPEPRVRSSGLGAL